jgi:hypothetical protein
VSLSGGTATFGTLCRHRQDGDGHGFTLTGAGRQLHAQGRPVDHHGEHRREGVTGSFTAENKTYDGNVSATI